MAGVREYRGIGCSSSVAFVTLILRLIRPWRNGFSIAHFCHLGDAPALAIDPIVMPQHVQIAEDLGRHYLLGQLASTSYQGLNAV